MQIQSLLSNYERSRVNKYFKRFNDQHAYLDSIINDILDLAKLHHKHFNLNLEEFDLLIFINSVIDMLGEQASIKKIELAAFVDTDVPLRIRTD